MIVLVKWNEKCKLLLLKCSLVVQTKRNQEKVVVTKICFYGLLKQNEKWKCVMENKGFVAKMIDLTGNNSMLTSKYHFLCNILAPCWWIIIRLYNRVSVDETVEMRGNNPMLTSKLHVLWNVSAPCWWIFMTS